MRPILLLALAILGISYAAEEGGGEMNLTDRLLKAEGAAAYNLSFDVLKNIKVDREQLYTAAKLLFESSVRKRNDDFKLTGIVRVLVMFGNDESSELLTKNIAFKPNFTWDGRIPRPRDTYPCLGALIDLGSVAVSKIIARVKICSDETELTLYRLAIESIGAITLGVSDGSEARKAFLKFIADQAGAEKLSDVERENLQKMLSSNAQLE